MQKSSDSTEKNNRFSFSYDVSLAHGGVASDQREVAAAFFEP